MNKVIFSKKSKLQISWIWQYIAQDNLFYANEVLNKIYNSIHTISIYPNIWRKMMNIVK